MMPYGPMPTGGCPQCGCPTGAPAGGFGAPMPGTYAPPMPTGFGGAAPAAGFAPWSSWNVWNPFFWNPIGLGWGLGGERRWGGTYTPQFLISGLPTDEEIEEMVYDAIDADPLIPYDAEINVESDAGTVTLTGTVPSKEIKHAAGDDAWWIPGVDDVRNELQVVPRRARPTPTARAQVQPRGAETAPPTMRAGGPTRMRRS